MKNTAVRRSKSRTATVRKATPAQKATSAATPGHALFTLQIPPLGAVVPGEGGIFAGIVFGDDGLPAYQLILHEDAPAKRVTWQKAIEWAKGLEAGGHKDFALPDRRDAAVLFANNHLLQITTEWHWLSEQLAAYPEYAWVQGFNVANQYTSHKGHGFRARAVRRAPIR